MRRADSMGIGHDGERNRVGADRGKDAGIYNVHMPETVRPAERVGLEGHGLVPHRQRASGVEAASRLPHFRKHRKRKGLQ